MSAFPKAAVRERRLRGSLYVCFWPKADIRTESKWWFLDVRFGENSGRSEPEPSGVVDTIGVGSSNDKAKPA